MALVRTVVTISNAVLGGTGTNTWHLRTIGPDAGAPDLIDDLMGIVKQMYDTCNALFAGGTTIRWDGQSAGVGPDEDHYFEGTAWNIFSAGVGDSLPPATALCLNWRGESGDRSRRGRTFLGPISASANDSTGTPNPTLLTTVRGAAAALVGSSLSDANGAVGVWSRQEGVFRDFAASSVKDQFAVLRSRRD